MFLLLQNEANPMSRMFVSQILPAAMAAHPIQAVFPVCEYNSTAMASFYIYPQIQAGETSSLLIQNVDLKNVYSHNYHIHCIAAKDCDKHRRSIRAWFLPHGSKLSFYC